MKKLFKNKVTMKLIIAILLLPIMFILTPSISVKATEITAVPIEIPVDYEYKRMLDPWGILGDYGSFKINLGNKKGTLVLKLYMLEKYPEPYATGHYDAAKVYRYIGIRLIEKNFGIERESGKVFAGFSRYATLQYTENNNRPTPRKDYKTINGFQNAAYTLNGERFIGAGVFLPEPMNNGRYYIDIPDGWNKDYWKVKAYFYENIDVEEELFNKFDSYFPLLGKVIWDGMELKPGQIGRLRVKVDTSLYRIEGENKIFSRTLKAGEDYRIYAFKPGMLDLGGGYFVDRDSKVEYKTPSKAKMELLKMRLE